MEMNTKNLSVVERALSLARKGVKLESITHNGVKCGYVGFTSEEDREKAEEFLRSSNFNGQFCTLTNIKEVLDKVVQIQEADISPYDALEEVTIGEKKYVISYGKKAIYTDDMKEVNNLSDMREILLPREAVRAILIERIRNN